MKNKKLLNAILPFITLTCILILWTVASISIGSKYILPSIKQTIVALFALLAKGSFYVAFLLTLLRSIIAFIISFIIAFIFAILSYRYPIAKKLIMPIIGIMRALPTVAVVLLLLFWTNSQIAPVIVTMLVVLPTIYSGAMQSLDDIDIEAVEMCVAFKVERKNIVKKVIIPSTAPSVLLSIGAGISLNLKLMVAAEVLASTANSLGGLLNYSNFNLQTATMLALVVVTVLTGLIIEKIFSLISKKAGKWQ